MIRKITSSPSDREMFLKLAEEFYHSPAVEHPVPRQNLERTYQEIITRDTYAEGYFLEYSGIIVGYALLSKTFSQEAGGIVVWIEELYLLPSYRSLGLGRAFFQFVHERFPNAARLRLEVEKDNTRAISLYEKMGFSVLPYEQMIKESNNPQKEG